MLAPHNGHLATDRNLRTHAVTGPAAVSMHQMALNAEQLPTVRGDPATVSAVMHTRGALGGPAADRQVRRYSTALLAIIVILLAVVEWVLLREGGWDAVILETVTNAIKHGAATGIWVELRYDDGVLRAEVRDDGRGGAGALDGGSGLQGLRDRVLALNGSLTVSSPPGDGTVVGALIPCG